MAENHPVAAGDCVSSLTKKKGFRDWHSIYDDAKNKDLKTKRPNPNALVIADSVFIPDKVKKDVQCATGLSHKFQVEGGPVKLRIVLVDHKDKPLANQAYQLTVSGKTSKSKTNDKGLIETVVPDDVTAGQLTIDFPASSAPKPKDPAPPKTVTYPPAIHPPDFKDTDDVAFMGGEMNSVQWTLAIGSLPSFNVVQGTQDRLRNLGYGLEGENGVEGTKTQTAIRAYQKRNKLTESGKVADVQNSVRDKHDNL